MLKAEVRFTIDPRPLLRGLEDRLKKNILRRAIRRGCRALQLHLKAAAPTKTGLLAKSIGVKISLKKDSLLVIGVVGPRRGYGKEVDGRQVFPSRYAWQVEEGRKEVSIVKKKVLSDHQRVFGKRVKPAAGSHFEAKTFSSHAEQYQEIVMQAIREGVAEALK